MAEVAAVMNLARRIQENVAKVIIGKDKVIELALAALFCEGHLLAEDVPGTGKTMMTRALAASVGASFNRIQFTPDLLPTDVTGVSVFNLKTQAFEFKPGPIMGHIVLADEINRATPRTQSALLECMEERQVTVDGLAHKLPRPFLVFATQNPIEQEGTFPLPEAQLDRFFLKLTLGYPSVAEEDAMLARLQHGHPIDSIASVASPAELLAVQGLVREVHVADDVRRYVAELVHATRRHADAAIGASPRGSLALFKAVQALAAIGGRSYVIPDDVKAMAMPVLCHRIILRPESQLRGRTAQQVVRSVLESVPVPVEAEAAR
ncbi:MAG TPA: MoxR family ATPase [Symbiobacteriaceae bacterium]|nr:MoxR family ATPase [Symbiobacteriaceae bacterium]